MMDTTEQIRIVKLHAKHIAIRTARRTDEDEIAIRAENEIWAVLWKIGHPLWELQEHDEMLGWDEMAKYPTIEEAKKDADFGADKEGRTVRVIDSSGTVVYEPSTACKTCEGDEKVPCCKCGGSGGGVENHLLCAFCSGKGDVPCPDCVEVDQ